MIYSTADDFRRALEARLRVLARVEQVVDPNRLRRSVAFERFLARLFAGGTERWVLKGGYALELRFAGRARSTRDLDLSVPPPPYIELLAELQVSAERDLGDFFQFRITGSPAGAELAGPPLGGSRFNVEALLAGRRFVAFPLDVGQGDVTVREPDLVSGRMDLSFAGVATPQFPVYPVEDHFAEKLHAYTAPYEFRTRVKDLVDMVLLIEQGLEASSLLDENIEATFRRYARHPRPKDLLEPPSDWQGSFLGLAEEVGLSVTDASEAYRMVVAFLAKL